MHWTTLISSILLILFTGTKGNISETEFKKLYPILTEYIRDFPKEFRYIPEERRYRLDEIVNFLADQHARNAPWQVVFISTTDSSVGQMATAWSKAAAHFFGFNRYQSFSGGLQPEVITENTIVTMEKAGFIVYRTSVSGTVVYRIKYSYNLQPVVSFSKKIDHARNPSSNYMAVVLDKNADLNLTDIKGTYSRLLLNYDDPTAYEGTNEAISIYDERSRQVAVEMFYVFSQLRRKLKNL